MVSKFIWIFLFACGVSLMLMGATLAPVNPDPCRGLEARVQTLESQVKELRRVVGLEGGLSEGLQNKGKKK